MHRIARFFGTCPIRVHPVKREGRIAEHGGCYVKPDPWILTYGDVNTLDMRMLRPDIIEALLQSHRRFFRVDAAKLDFKDGGYVHGFINNAIQRAGGRPDNKGVELSWVSTDEDVTCGNRYPCFVKIISEHLDGEGSRELGSFP